MTNIHWARHLALQENNSVLIHNLRQLAEHLRPSALDLTPQPMVAAALLEDALVDECAVLARETATSERELVAYVVSSKLLSTERLKSHLQDRVPAAWVPEVYVPVSTLPLTASGEVDEQALTHLEVIDSDLVQRWEDHLHLVPEIEQVAVVVQEQIERLPSLHLSDLLPGWKANLVNAVEASEASLVHSAAALQDSAPKAIALSNGGPLTLEENAPTILLAALKRAALQGLDKGIVYIQSDGSEIFQSYSALLCEAERVLRGLRQLGLQPQDKVIFQLERNQDFITAFWGCILGGFVPVPISIAPSYRESNGTINKLHHAWRMLERPIVLTSQTLVQAVSSLSTLLGLEDFQVETVDQLRICDPDQNWHVSQPHDLALLLLTSGSTGMPKGVMQSHRSLLSRSASTIQINEFSRDDVSLNWFPLDHVGGIVMFHIRDVYLGCQQIQAPTEIVLQDPLKWLDWIDLYRATITWAPNFAYGLINDRAEETTRRDWDLSSMRFILNAGEAIVAKTARRFLELLCPHGLPSTAMHPAWGMSETSSAVTFSHNFSLDSTTDNDLFVEVGAPLSGVSLRIVDTQNQVVDENNIGRLQVKGSMVTSGYYQNPDLNQNVFIDDGWFDTGDLGFLCKGCLTVTGRQKDTIIINGINYYSHEIEAVVEEVEGVEVSYTCACAVRTPDSHTDNLAIFFNSPLSNENLLELLKEIRTALVHKVGVNPAYLIPVEKDTIPKTAIGKIQRTQLSQRFEAGEFEVILKRIDILRGNANTLPDWFYRKKWRPKKAMSPVIQPTIGQSLVFLDRLGLGALLREELSKIKTPCISIEAGSDFAKLDNNRYCIDPKNPDHYRQLLKLLSANNLPITQVLHLWTYDNCAGEISSLEMLEQSQELGVYSLLFLSQALAQCRDSEHAVQLYVIASHAQQILPSDEIACERTPILGLIKTIPQEMPWLNCRHIDITTDQVEVNKAHILQELWTMDKDREVAYRNSQRLVPCLEKVDFRQEEKQELPFKHGGMYLLTGGLGGIGIEIAKYLLQHYKARLLLIGRTPLPERSTWLTYDEQVEDAVSQRIKAYLLLEQLGGEIVYEAADICDQVQLQQVVQQASSRWQCGLDGVIHLAGVIEEHLLVGETKASLAATLYPKVLGTWVLSQLVKDRPDSIFISFSSINGFFGGTAAGAYAAANSFLECFSDYQRAKCLCRSYCFSWSMWDEVGMSRNIQIQDFLRARGYHIIPAQQGLQSLLAGLHHDQPQLLIGLDGSKHPIRLYRSSQSYQLQKLCAYFTAPTAPVSFAKFQELDVSDRFQTRSICDFVQIQEMPLTATGEIDREHLVFRNRQAHKADTEPVAPRNKLERQLTTIWQDLLGVPQVGVHNNFFELGGNSLLATQLISRVRATWAVELPLRSLFEQPTVAGLAERIETALRLGQDISAPSLLPVTRDKEIPLSFAQQRLWFFEQLEPNRASYNIPIAIRLSGQL
ncbi:MAG: SDR family NAD(P)-dependent oxidoreductase, partial [Chroococcidiopsidaceae cyanobacterium CP_BM_ER_R8_30]|nr:SDR family NAD(P)-dependent oxidoreductase [Chroococcidiopsidaceae cyanobacterium CP_BM_ER_R8_30]